MGGMLNGYGAERGMSGTRGTGGSSATRYQAPDVSKW